MKTFVKYLLFAVCVAAFTCISVLVLGEARNRRHLTTCTSVEISFRDSLGFVTENDIRSYLAKDCNTTTGTRIDSIRLDLIEKALNSRSAIKESQAWVGDDGVVHISIAQREPVARMLTRGNAFYMDDRGDLFPVQGNCTKEVPVFEGDLPLDDPSWIPGILKLLEYMKRHRLGGSVSCFEVLRSGELIMHPAEGGERFIFGKADKAAAKFARINQYRKAIKPNVEEGYYSTVNVKYEGQIVCRK